MKLSFKAPIFALVAAATLAGCASTPSEIEMMADQRASLIESSLPITVGPLNIMSAKANGNIVDITMIYNSTATIAPSALVDASASAYCKDENVRSVLDKGVIYHINVRSERGQMLVDKTIDSQSCLAVDQAQ
ncbi:MAG: type II secretion system pilot lipoprotein GspS-beta [Vibrio sp.]